MLYPNLTDIYSSRSNIDVFGGYNHNIRIPENEFYEMTNLTSDNYPVMSPRGKRGTKSFPSSATQGQSVTHNPQGMIAKDSLCYVDDNTLFINDERITGLLLEHNDAERQLISMGAYLIIMPDKKYINTEDHYDSGDIELSEMAFGGVSYSLCKIDGSTYGENIPTSKPAAPDNGDYWIDTSSFPHVLKVYSEDMWVPVATTYVKIQATGIAANIKQYDAVKISGITNSQLAEQLNGKVSAVWEFFHDEETPANDYIVVVGMLDNVADEGDNGTITISRKMPAMDFIIESGNRLWGCRYGVSNEGKIVNEIYASKLGDFKNWECFMGLASDSYAASVGTDGPFTGAVTYLGYPMFFKENCYHKVYGNFPSNYQIQTAECRGVQKGAAKSLAIVNETLYYKSRTGICAYNGSLPGEVSEKLGSIHYSAVDETMSDKLRNGAAASAINNKYYISMKSEKDDKWHLFVYDTALGMWNREDNTRADSFCLCRGELYYIDHDTKTIKTVLGTGTPDAEPVKWSAETGVIGMDLPDKKYISRILLRLSMAVGSRLRVYAQYDSTSDWIQLCSLTGKSLQTFMVPIRPRRCDHFRLRFTGTGDVKMFSITKTIEQGSDLR